MKRELPDVDKITVNVETQEVIKMTEWCSYHERYEPKEDFYFESAPKAKNPGEVRNMCVEAWNIVFGKKNFSKIGTLRNKKEESCATVFDYLKD